MGHERFFVDETLQEGCAVAIGGKEFHHLHHVMRAQMGDQIELVNGKGQLAHAQITSLNKNQATLALVSVTEKNRCGPELILAQALPRLSRLEWILEKGTELGVTAFWLFPGILSEKETISPNQQERMGHILIAAMKQCGRLDLPTLSLRPPLLEWDKIPGRLFFGDTHSHAPLLWEESVGANSPAVLFVGPEKGFDLREEAYLKEHLGAVGVRWHGNVLRTETAALAGLQTLYLLQNKLGIQQ